ncbi:MAG: arsenate reductase ArsC [bacterium]|nr:arsenate reductase ArsC [bacterium]MDE0417424.1 arsenate reductase ArsC [bacterium]
MADTPGAVLFACNYNAVRSPMAEGLMKSLYGHSIFIDSVGVRPTEDANPFMIEVMAEIGIDMSGHRPKTFDDIDDGAESFDLVITMSPEAQHRAVELTRFAALDVEYWMTFDPVAIEGNRDMILDAFRGVRDHIRQRIGKRFPSTSLSAI